MFCDVIHELSGTVELIVVAPTRCEVPIEINLGTPGRWAGGWGVNIYGVEARE